MMKMMKKILSVSLCALLLLSLCTGVFAEEKSENLVYNNGTMDGILSDGETEKTLVNDWVVSYPVATFGGTGGDSPAKVKNIDGNNVLVLEYSAGSGNFASYYADLYADGTLLPAGKYELSFDLKAVGTNFATDNVGFNLYNQYSDIPVYRDGVWKDVTEGNDGWMHYSQVLEVYQDTQFVDSIQMWFNTMGKDPAECALYIDNISICKLPETAQKLELEYIIGSGTALTLNLPATELTIAEKDGYTLEVGVDFSYENGIITLFNDYADGLAAGKNHIAITADGEEYELTLTIRASKPTLPESTEGYLMQETLVGGTFDIFDEGFSFSLEQVEGWGSNITYDDPGVIVNLNGNKVLRLQKDQKSSYSSAFAFISPTIQAGDVLTFRFDYKLDVANPESYVGQDINLSFVSASNMQMCKIPLDNTKAPQTSGDGDYQWDVQYTDLEDGWIRVELNFVANTALLSYNSMRFLMPTNFAAEGDALYVDNVSLVLWAKPEAPQAAVGVDLTFDQANPADIFALIDMKALDPTSIQVDGKELTSEDWAINPGKDTITLKKEFLATLDNGEHTLTVTSMGGSCTVTVTVKGEVNNTSTSEPAADNVGLIIGIAIVVVVAAVVVIVVLRKKKENT